MKKVTLALFMIAFTMVTISCNQSQKTQRLSGDYICTEHWNEDLTGQIKMTFNNDSVSFAGIVNTAYRIKDDSLFIDMHKYEMGFLINGETLTTKGAAGVVSYTKK